ncbi:hypothetical protein J4E91_002740 [Alternaria rosae]|nr:hypothetical protein J4E91_002740 [Alternaria rosae]
MSFKNILVASAFALCAFAAPIPDCDDGAPAAPPADVPTTEASLTAANLIAIAPTTASCDGAPFADECADATAAATAITKAFETYKITSKGERAAIVAYELFESGNFKYKRNHFPAPGRPGQGTRMMAMPDIVEKYATAVAGADAVATAKATGVDAVLDLVNSDDEKSFGSAAWYVTTCSADVRAGLDAATIEGWHAFLTNCVNTSLADERDTLWTATTPNVP